MEFNIVTASILLIMSFWLVSLVDFVSRKLNKKSYTEKRGK